MGFDIVCIGVFAVGMVLVVVSFRGEAIQRTILHVTRTVSARRHHH